MTEVNNCPAGGSCGHDELCNTRGCLRLDPPLGHQSTMSAADIEALQLVRSAAQVAVDRGAIHGLFTLRVAAAVGRVTAIIEMEAARAR